MSYIFPPFLTHRISRILCMHACSVMSDSVTPWTVACQDPLSMGFPKQEYWNVLPFPSPGYLPNPGIEPTSPPLQAASSPSEPSGKSKKPNLAEDGIVDIKHFEGRWSGFRVQLPVNNFFVWPSTDHLLCVINSLVESWTR